MLVFFPLDIFSHIGVSIRYSDRYFVFGIMMDASDTKGNLYYADLSMHNGEYAIC